ncbi:uncharacterized mitochondrial protein-like protein [Tanacetum coccineum]
MCTYLKNMEGKKPKNLKNKSFDYIQKMFDRAFKRVNTFVDFRTDLLEGSSKRAGEELEQESTKKQKVDEDKDTAELQSLTEVIPDEEEVAIDVVPLATKPPTISSSRECEYKKAFCDPFCRNATARNFCNMLLALCVPTRLKPYLMDPIKGTSSRLMSKDGDPLPDPSLYRAIMGSLVYLTVKRLNISYAVHIASQFVCAPTTVHWDAILHILMYLRGTGYHTLLFSSTSALDMHAYCDSDWAGDVVSRKLLGFVYFWVILLFRERVRYNMFFLNLLLKPSTVPWQ